MLVLLPFDFGMCYQDQYDNLTYQQVKQTLECVLRRGRLLCMLSAVLQVVLIVLLLAQWLSDGKVEIFSRSSFFLFVYLAPTVFLVDLWSGFALRKKNVRMLVTAFRFHVVIAFLFVSAILVALVGLGDSRGGAFDSKTNTTTPFPSYPLSDIEELNNEDLTRLISNNFLNADTTTTSVPFSDYHREFSGNKNANEWNWNKKMNFLQWTTTTSAPIWPQWLLSNSNQITNRVLSHIVDADSNEHLSKRVSRSVDTEEEEETKRDESLNSSRFSEDKVFPAVIFAVVVLLLHLILASLSSKALRLVLVYNALEQAICNAVVNAVINVVNEQREHSTMVGPIEPAPPPSYDEAVDLPTRQTSLDQEDAPPPPYDAYSAANQIALTEHATNQRTAAVSRVTEDAVPPFYGDAVAASELANRSEDNVTLVLQDGNRQNHDENLCQTPNQNTEQIV